MGLTSINTAKAIFDSSLSFPNEKMLPNFKIGFR